MGFLARWISDAVRLALSLALAAAAMQAPALTRDYAAALLQVSDDARRDIDGRKDSARRYYGIDATGDAEVIQALQPHEPSNAETLARSVERVNTLHAAYARIEAASPLTQPVVAAVDSLDDPRGQKHAVLRLALESFVPQIVLTVSAAIWALIGLVAGSLLANLVLSLLGAAFRGRRRRVA